MSHKGKSLTQDQINQIIIELLKQGSADLSRTFYDKIQDKAYSLGFIDEKPQYGTGSIILSTETFLKTVDKYWEYVIKGFIAPGLDQYNILDFRAHLTDIGKKMIYEEINPYSEEKYVTDIRKRAKILIDDDAEIYLIESVKSFNYYCYLGAMVLLGGFSERIFVNFLQRFIETIKNEDDRKTFEEKVENKFIATKFKEFMKYIEKFNNIMPKNLKNQLSIWLNNFFDYVRRVRNEVGHPTGYEVSREEILAMFLTFPRYLENLNLLLNFFQENPL